MLSNSESQEMAPTESKRSGPRRMGDEYQDHTALRLALEMYIQGEEFELFIDYEKVGVLDDIVVLHKHRVDAYQIKHAASLYAVYQLSDFTDSADAKRVHFSRFSKSWQQLRKQFPSHKLVIHLYSNYSLGPDVSEVVMNDGRFMPAFISGTTTAARRAKIRRKLKEATVGLSEDEFQAFLSCFHFQLTQLSLPCQQDYIRCQLLDHELGLNDPAVFNKLALQVREHAIESRQAITQTALERFFEKWKSKYVLSQGFEVERPFYVEQPKLKEHLEKVLQTIDGKYLLVTGLPGSGKSTSLTAFFDDYENSSVNPVVRYYCFVGVDDNFQKLRAEAETFRVNLLKNLQYRFSDVVTRRYDYSERQFYQVLETLGAHFAGQNKKIIIFLDGLDHAERMKSEGIAQGVINALPASLPKGVVIVIGTQELQNPPYFLASCRESSDTYIEMPLFDEGQTKEYLVTKRGLDQLTPSHVHEIHQKSEGLPLYLRYIAEILSQSEDMLQEIGRIPLIPNGQIKEYYRYLWSVFEQTGRANVKHLCGVLACLNFPVPESELIRYQTVLTRPTFEDCLKYVQHLLRKHQNLVQIFHTSFREFIQTQLGKNWKKEINEGILAHLKEQEYSELWFWHGFEYAYDVEDYGYVLEKVDREFVDRALITFYPDRVIADAISWAIESAKATQDLVAFSRLGALKFRTTERVKENLDRSVLSRALLAISRVDAVMKYSYSPEHKQWLVGASDALQLLIDLAKHNRIGKGLELFPVFLKAFKGTQLDRAGIVNYARCMGIYMKSVEDSLKWLSSVELEPEVLEPTQTYAPGYAPHLEAYIDSLIEYQPDECWKGLKKVEKLFPNQLVRILLIRRLAIRKTREILAQEIEEYLALFGPGPNPEIAYYAAMAALHPDKVAEKAGPFSMPALNSSSYFLRSDPCLHNFRMRFIALGYEGPAVRELQRYLGSRKSWWTTYLLYLARAAECIGKHWSQAQDEWYDTAIQALETLQSIKAGERESVHELLELCRDEMQQSLYLLTRAVCERYSAETGGWFATLQLLQKSELWTTQYGIEESIEDYSFELCLYRRLAHLPSCKAYIVEILEVCDRKYRQATLLKGGTRSSHYLEMATIGGRCGNRVKAEEWIQRGIEATLIYGYHKDITLFQLIDVLGILNRREPEEGLERCVHILDMVDWMPHLTDGDETRYLPKTIFSEVAALDEEAALKLLRQYARSKSRWQMQDCLEIWLEHARGVDLEVLWALTAMFANHFSDDERHIRQAVRAKQRVIELAEEAADIRVVEGLKQRLDHFIRTSITPRHWSTVASRHWKPDEDSTLSVTEVIADEDVKKPYTFGGKLVTIKEIEKISTSSFVEFIEILKRLREENAHFYESDWVKSALRDYILRAKSTDELLEIQKFCLDDHSWVRQDELRLLGQKLLDVGETEPALACFEWSYTSTIDWIRWEKIREDLETIANHDRHRARQLAVNDCYRELRELGGFQVPALAASACDILGETDKVQTIYSDYLGHCKELFAHLPPGIEYSWLRDFTPEGTLDETCVSFMITDLDTVEFDLGKRLVDALRELCLVRPGVALPKMVSQLSNANEFIQERLYAILHTAAGIHPEIVEPYAQRLVELLPLAHFQRNMIVMKIIDRLAEQCNLPTEVRGNLANSLRLYSRAVRTPSCRLIRMDPSDDFMDLYENAMARTFRNQIQACCDLLGLDVHDVLAKMENTLVRGGWTKQAQQQEIDVDFHAYVHPQGYPRINIITNFSMKLLRLFNEILDEAVQQVGYPSDNIECLWRILQPADPEYGLKFVRPRPSEIPRLSVSDKEAWLSDLRNGSDSVVREQLSEMWTTVFEMRVMTQDEQFRTPYMETISVFSSLVKSGNKCTPGQVREAASCLLDLRWCSKYESMTLKQAHDLLAAGGATLSEGPYLPILAWRRNNPLFLGFEHVISLPAPLIERYGFTFSGLDLYDKDELVVSYGVWQEGYENETYSRALLSYGTRLLVHKKLMQRILADFDAELCQETTVKRLYCADRYHPDPSEQVTKTSFRIIHN